MDVHAAPAPSASQASALSQVRILGTNHISAHSARQVRAACERFSPTVIAVELDRRRLRALQERKADDKERKVPLSLARQVGVTGYLFLLLGAWLQRKMGGVMDVEPGVDMLEAVSLARERKAQLALVDQDIFITMRRLSVAFTWREKMRMLGDVVLGPLRREKIQIRIDRVPSAATIRTLMRLLRERYPSIHSALIAERDAVMARNVLAIAQAQPDARILLVVGAGHEEGVRALLETSGKVELA